MFTLLSTPLFTPLGPEFSCCYRPSVTFEYTPFLFDPLRCARVETPYGGAALACHSESASIRAGEESAS